MVCYVSCQTYPRERAECDEANVNDELLDCKRLAAIVDEVIPGGRLSVIPGEQAERPIKALGVTLP